MPKVYTTRAHQEQARLMRLIFGYMGTMSITELADKIHMERTTLSRKLRGKSPITLLEYIQIKMALGIEEEK